MTTPFRLDPAFVASYADRPVKFGYNGLGELVYLRTYSRVKDNGEKEKWHETIERVVNGCYSMQKRWIESHSLGWSDAVAQESAREMFDKMFTMRFLPPGRGLWAMGSPTVETRGLHTALNNCCYVSTANLATELSKPFCFLADVSMLGTGTGFDVKGAGTIYIQKPDPDVEFTFTVPDSREGWVDALRRLLDSYFIAGSVTQRFDYSQVRPEGAPIKGFGGNSSGHKPLEEMLEAVRAILAKEQGLLISVTTITDIMNLIGKCIVAGGIRRVAEIAFGSHDDEEFINLKNYELNPHRQAYGWASNNSIYAEIGMDYSKVAESIRINGEPGLYHLTNAQEYGRMNGVADFRDHRAQGGNPCLSADTLILTTNGEIPIRDLVGKQFIALVHGETHPSTTRGFWKTAENQQLYRVQLADGSYVRCTSNHQILTENEKWVEAGELQIGDLVQLTRIDRRSGEVLSPVVSVTPDGVEDVYDATVPSVARFTANGIIVHNCMEQTLESYEMCCLVENFPTNCTDREDFLRTLKFSYLYAKTVTLGKTHWPETNRVMLRNRRIGCSLSGLALFIAKHGIEELRQWCEEGYETIQRYDKVYSAWCCVPLSIKTTSIKPSGTVSLLAGVPAGCHHPNSRFYIRRVRLADNSPLIAGLRKGGYRLEPDAYSPNTTVVEYPVDAGEGLRGVAEVSMWEQLALVAFLQRHYADNSVSATITFDPKTEGPQIVHALQYYQYQLKGISFLPRLEQGAYKQMPYEEITEEVYKQRLAELKKTTLVETADAEAEKFCDGDKCVLPGPK